MVGPLATGPIIFKGDDVHCPTCEAQEFPSPDADADAAQDHAAGPSPSDGH